MAKQHDDCISRDLAHELIGKRGARGTLHFVPLTAGFKKTLAEQTLGAVNDRPNGHPSCRCNPTPRQQPSQR